MTILLVEFEAAVDDAGTIETQRAATEGYNHPSAPAFFPEVVRDTISIKREIRGGEQSRRGAEVDFSDLVLINADGRHDYMLDYGLDGREARGYLLDSPEQPYSERITLFVATMGPASFDFDTITIPLRDRLSELEQAFHLDSYEGASGDTLEGESTVKGQPKPAPTGEILNTQLPLVDPDRQIYQFSAVEDAEALSVYIGGAPLSRGADYSSEQDMLDNPPTGHDMRVWPRSGGSGGYIRLAGTPVNTVTADVSTDNDQRIGSVLKRLALRAPTIDDDDISQADVDALNSAMPEPVGITSGFETTILREMEWISQGAAVWFGFDRLGLLRFGLWEAPNTGGPRFLVADPVQQPISDDDFDVHELEAESTKDKDLPVYEAVIQYARNHTVQIGLDTPGLTAGRRSFIEQEWQSARAIDSSVRSKHANARTVEIPSGWATTAGAESAADRILQRDKARRIRLVLSTPLDKQIVDKVDLAGSVEVRVPRYGMNAGMPFRIRWLSLDPVSNLVEFGLWG